MFSSTQNKASCVQFQVSERVHIESTGMASRSTVPASFRNRKAIGDQVGGDFPDSHCQSVPSENHEFDREHFDCTV